MRAFLTAIRAKLYEWECDRILPFQFPPYSDFSKVCVTFNRGQYTVFYNGVEIKQVYSDPHPTSSTSPTTLGYVEGKSPFKGYIDDVSMNAFSETLATSFVWK